MSERKPKLLITGGLGFVGSNLIKHLVALGNYELNVVERYVTGRYANLGRSVETHFVDLRDSNSVKTVLKHVQPDVVIHMAAISPVSYSYEHPQEVIENNLMGTINLAEGCREMIPSFKHFIYAGCYDESTEVYVLGRGFVHYSQLKIGDEVLSINLLTEEIEAKQVQDIVIKDYSGPMYHFAGRRLDLLVTPNHNMLIRGTGVKRNLFFESAEIAARRSLATIPNGHWNGTIKQAEYSPTLFYLVGLYIGDGYCDIHTKTVTTKSSLSHDEYITQNRDASGRFTALQTLDPRIIHSQSARNFLCMPQEDKARARAESALQELNLVYHQHAEGLYITSEYLYSLFDQCGHGANCKSIPAWMLEYPSQHLEMLLQGILDSDGDGEKSFTTVSRGLVDSATELIVKLGRCVTVLTRDRTHETKTIEGRSVQGGISYDVYISNTERNFIRNNISLERYTGKIWCPVVKDNHNFLVRRNNRIAFCGNTTEEYGVTQDRPAKESSRCIPNSPYSVSKFAGTKYLEFMNKAYDFPTTVMRCTNTYGRTNDTHFFIEKIVTQMIANPNGEVLMGDDEAIREFMFVDDHVNAYLSVLAQREKSTGQIFNFSTGKPLSLNEVIKITAKLTDFKGEFVKHSMPKRPLDIFDHSLNSDKAKEILGWSAKVSLEDGLKKTIAYWKEKLDQQKSSIR